MMVLYRRNRVPGGTYFFTETLRDRSSGRAIASRFLCFENQLIINSAFFMVYIYVTDF
jgi:hypothetical protein